MITLTKVELRRLAHRRMVAAAVLFGLAVAILMLFVLWQDSKPLSGAERAVGEQQYALALDDWNRNGEQQKAECFEQEKLESERSGAPVDFGCASMGAPQREWFLTTSPPLEDQLPQLLSVVALLVALIAFGIGGTFTAAEFSTGSMGNWLTFEPRRLRVFASKLAATVLAALPIAVVVLALVAFGAVAILSSHELASGFTSEHRSAAMWLSIRALGLVVIGALVGVSLGFLMRHTAAVLGTAIGIVILGQALFQLVEALRPWDPLLNIQAWIENGTTYTVVSCSVTPQGQMCDGIEKTLTFASAATYLWTITGALVLLAALVFRRRDVT